MMKSRILAGISGLALASSFMPMTGAFAQATADAQRLAGAPEEIIVTARRKAERIQDVPVAVTTLSAEVLAQKNIQNLSDMQRMVPSLNVTGINARGTAAAITLRGQRQNDQVVTVDPSVGFYLNELYLARPQGYDTTAFDLTNIQVLKGPQGTLFGRNTTGGAILLTSRRPGNEFGGYIRAYGETPAGAGVQAAVDVPLGEKVAVRVAGNYQYRQGYTTVINTGQKLDDRNRWAARVTIDVKPTDNLTSTFVFDGFKSDENGVGTYAFNYIPGGAGSAAIAGLVTATGYPADYATARTLDWHQTRSSILGVSAAKTFGFSNTTTYTINDRLLVKNIIGTHTFDGHDTSDQDGAPANVIINDGFAEDKQFSEEFQVQGTFNALELITGVYYFVESGNDDVHTFSLRPPLVGAYTNNYFWGRNVSTSGFAHGSYTLPFENRTRIYGGLRYTHDLRQVQFRNRSVAANGAITCTVVGAGADCALPAQTSFNAVTWDAGIDYQPFKDSLLYFTASRGYRSGGYNGRATNVASQIPFRPEKIMNYEIGAKSEFDVGNTRGGLNVAAYTSDYSDIQRTVIRDILLPGNVHQVVSVLVNAASATIKGMEVEGWIKVMPTLTVRGNYSYTHARYNSFTAFNNATGLNDLDASRNLFSGVPANQAGLGLDWDVIDEQNIGGVRFSADVSYVDGFQLNDINVPGGVAKPATLVNASITWDHLLDTKLTASLYCKNMFDKNYITGGLLLTSALDVSSVYHGAPRVVGLSVTVPFGAGE